LAKELKPVAFGVVYDFLGKPGGCRVKQALVSRPIANDLTSDPASLLGRDASRIAYGREQSHQHSVARDFGAR